MNRTSSVVAICCFAAALLGGIATAAGIASGQNPAIAPGNTLQPPPNPEPCEVSTIQLPPNVRSAVLVNYMPDGEHLVMEVHLVGRTKSDLAVMKDDGTGFRCLTEGLKEKIGGEMPVPLPDGKRIYTPSGILECSPSVLDCKEARILPLVYPKLKGGNTLMRIATNLSPDGIHGAYTLITTRGVYVLISKLTRFADDKGERYEFTDSRVVGGVRNFVGDPANLKISSYGSGEVKSFAGQGRYLTTISAFESSNCDIAKLDLATGDATRFTRHFSYDEGVYPSPDGEWTIVQTHRHTNRMDVFGLIPRPLIAGQELGWGVGLYRNEVVNPGNPERRFYGLVMLDKYGDRARLPEDGYTGQMITVAKDNVTEYNHFGNFTWHPTSTRGVFWEQKDHLKAKSDEADGRLRMIRFTSRRPTMPLTPFTPEMTWAPTIEDMPATNEPLPDKGHLKGDFSGYADFVTERQTIGIKEVKVFKITYANFSDDGEYILNGGESHWSDGNAVPVVHWEATITVTGKRNGFLKAENVVFNPMEIGSGTIRAQLGDHKAEIDLARGGPTGVPGELR